MEFVDDRYNQNVELQFLFTTEPIDSKSF